MTAPHPDHRATELSDVWDSLLIGDDTAGSYLDPRIAVVLQRVQSSRSTEELSQDLVDRIWAGVIAGTAPMWTPDVAAMPDATGIPTSAPPASMPERSNRTWRLRTQVVMDALVRFAWIVVAGFVGGFVAGVGGRLAMRLAGSLTREGNRFILTENGNRVGEITADGTLFLGLMAGGAGVGVVLMYLIVRDRLSGAGWQRSLVFSVLLLFVFGYVLMDPGNPDYQLFGPAWLNVVTFSSLYLVMGFCTSQAYELSRRFRSQLRSVRGYRGIRLPLLIVSAAVCLLGLLLLVGTLFLTATGLPIVVLSAVAWVVGRYAWARRVLTPRLPAPLRPWGLLLAPGVVGCLLTVRGITEILAG